MRAYDLDTGEEIWSMALPHQGNHLAASPVLKNERLYLFTVPKHVCLDVSRIRGEGARLVWEQEVHGELCGTPLVTGGTIFSVDESGSAFCRDADSGAVLWETSLDDIHYASVVKGSAGVYFSGADGLTTVVAPAPQLHLLGRNALGEDPFATLAPAGKRILIRTVKNLCCVQ